MESRIRNIFLNRAGLLLACGLGASAALADEALTPDTELIFEPKVERREIKTPRIDTEDFELGLYGGLLSVEDFGVNPVIGVRAAYHITEDFFTELAVAQSRTTKTSFERLSGAAELLSDDERLLTYYNISLGYNLLPGEVFVGGKRSFNSALYVIGGIGSTRFAGDDRFTFNLGAGYRFLATDWLAIHADVRDHLFKSDLIGEERRTNNIEITLGATFFF